MNKHRCVTARLYGEIGEAREKTTDLTVQQSVRNGKTKRARAA